jgi:hypothetical protein
MAIEVPLGAIRGDFNAVVVDANGDPPIDIIRVSDEFRIRCTWYVDGPLARMLCGCWHVRAAFESVGPGPEFFTDENVVQIDGRTGSGNPYTTDLVFPVGADFPGAPPGTTWPKVQPEGIGVYEVAVILTCRSRWNNAPVPIAGSVNLEKLTIFDDN